MRAGGIDHSLAFVLAVLIIPSLFFAREVEKRAETNGGFVWAPRPTQEPFNSTTAPSLGEQIGARSLGQPWPGCGPGAVLLLHSRGGCWFALFVFKDEMEQLPRRERLLH